MPLKVAVCVKQVISADSALRSDPSGTWVREDAATWTLNEPDAYALEEALRLKDKLGVDVIAVSAGPSRVTQVLRECLARGADRAIHVDGDLPPTDARGTAEALAAGLAGDRMDLVLTGLQSTDAGSAEVGVLLAELLGAGHVTIAVSLAIEGGTIKVTRELEAGWFQHISLPLPAVVTLQSGINQLRYATLKNIMAAKKKEIRVVPRPDLRPPAARVVKVYAPGRSSGTRLIPGSAAEAARELVRILRDDERVL